MEKLIDLINEYQEPFVSWVESYNEATGMFITNVGQLIDETEITSKKFGFIEWLVENDKIDREQKTKKFRLQIELDNGSYGELGGEARLLMLLSISDTPIDDLISYLK